MNRTSITLLAAGLLVVAVPANADHRVYRDYGYDAPRYVHYDHRRHMPRWLQRHDQFRLWYRHTPLRYNRYLVWDELYSIFLWERRYFPHRRVHHYRDHRHGFDYYRKYWKHDHRKKHGGKRHRYDDHHDRYDRRDRHERYDKDDWRDDDDRRRDRRRRD